MALTLVETTVRHAVEGRVVECVSAGEGEGCSAMGDILELGEGY